MWGYHNTQLEKESQKKELCLYVCHSRQPHKEGSRISCTEMNKTGKFILADPTGGHRPLQIVVEKLSPNFSEREVDSHREKGRETKITSFTKEKFSSEPHFFRFSLAGQEINDTISYLSSNSM